MCKTVAVAAIAAAFITAGLLAEPQAAQEHDHATSSQGSALKLSPELAALLSEEMLAIEKGVGVLTTAIAAGDWPRVAETGESIEKSYILAQRLTTEQFEELARVLPPRFKALDSAFHGSAAKLARAAGERNAELAVFYSYRLMDACVECHATFARTRFPGFGEENTAHDQHH